MTNQGYGQIPYPTINATPCYILTIANPVYGTTLTEHVEALKVKQAERYRTVGLHSHAETGYITPERLQGTIRRKERLNPYMTTNLYENTLHLVNYCKIVRLTQYNLVFLHQNFRIMRKDKVIHVELIEPYQGQIHFYFGSMAAIFDTLQSDTIGMSLTSLWSHFHSGCLEYRTRKAIIRKGNILRKSGNRHKS